MLAKKRVLVVGAGRTGIAVAAFAAARGAEVTLTDGKPASAFGDSLAPLKSAGPGRVHLELGGHRAATFAACELIVLSPGVPPGLPEIIAAQQRGVAVTGEVELASGFIEAPIVAITGTNGKSTVTSLCGEIARATGRPTFVGGNLGTPLIEAAGTPAAMQHGLIVCEVSSFQLETCERFHPRAAVILNLTPDHLDRHGTMSAYSDAKFRIARQLGPGDVLVLNEDDPLVMDGYDRLEIAARVIPLRYSTRRRSRGRAASPTVPGAPDSALDPNLHIAPDLGLDLGGYVDGDELVLRLAGAGVGAVVEERYPQSDLRLVGRHNLGNALSAYLAMRGAGLATPAEVRAGARAFQPLPHRMELVGEKHAVRYYDDSKGTNVAAVVASIDGFPRPFILIAGGRDKGGSYAPLREALAKGTARGVIVIGEAAEQIASAVAGALPVHRAATLPEAVVLAASLARGGDAVVLSPACSSYDMFDNYGHRGRVFRESVEALA